MKLEDGRGSGRYAFVDNEFRLSTFAVSENEDKHVNRTHQGQWSIYVDGITASGANDYFFYLKNTSESSLYAISDIRTSSSVATEITYEHVTGIPSYISDTDSDVISRYLGSSREPSIIAKHDTDITGLNSEGVLFFEECAVADTRYKLSTTSNIMIPPGQAIAFKRVAATGEVKTIISLTELE